jgi:cyclase
MLARRIIACLDVRDGQVVKGVKFEGLRSAGEPAALARRYNEEGIDELVILDVTATIEKRRALAATVGAVARELFIPLSVGGGIKDEGDAAAAIEAAPTRSASTRRRGRSGPDHAAREQYGSQAVIVAIDAKRAGSGYAVYSPRRATAAARDAVEGREAQFARRRRNPATSIDRDGTLAAPASTLQMTAAVLGRSEHPGDRPGGAGTSITS